MATEYHYFDGKIKWAKLREEQAKAFEDDNRGKFCAVNFYFADNDQRKAFQLLKTRKQFKIDSEGEEYIDFRRYLVNNVAPELGGAPKVLTKENEPYTGALGNGTTGTLKISTYDTKSGKATRLEAFRIENLVEYIPEEREDGNEDRPF